MKQLDPKAVWLFWIYYVFVWALFLIVVGIWPAAGIAGFILKYARSFIPMFIIGVIVAWIVSMFLWYLWARLVYKYYRYELADQGFRKVSGVIFKHYVTIPYDRIQNVDVLRGPIERLLGLSHLMIQTAGYSGNTRRAMAEGSLPGLSREVAEALRDELVRRSKGGAGV